MMRHAFVSVLSSLVIRHMCANQRCRGKKRVKITFVRIFLLFYLVKMLQNRAMNLNNERCEIV